MRKSSGLLALCLALGLWLGAGLRDHFDAWVDAAPLPHLTPDASVEMIDRNGQLLRAFMVADGRWRFATTLADVDPDYVAMLLSYEDQRFYHHSGVDLWAMGRAFAQALWHGRVVSGGSTLTMQVARLLEEGTTGEMAGKLRQIRLALKLERILTKEQILGLYLQLAPFGGNLEGVRAASLAYLGKEPQRLTPAQAALLVALPQSPETRRPDRFSQRADIARARVLKRAVQAGLLDPEDAVTALREPVTARRIAFPNFAPHLADRLRAQDPLRPRHNLSLDRDIQASFESLAQSALRDFGPEVQIALIAVEHKSGAVLASVGSAAYRADQRQGFVDMTRAMRSPGSTLKPLVYGLAFEDGLAHPETLMSDRPMVFGTYAPQNFDRQFRGDIRLREALRLSLNIPVVALTEAISPARLLAAMGRAGMEYALPNDQPGLAIALGGIGVSLHDLVQLYAAMARGGVVRPLSYHLVAEPSEHGKQGQRLMSAVAAWQVGDILAGLAPPAGMARNRLAYKTGTSYGHRDAWAIGYDGEHVIGVWMGRPDGTPVPGNFGTDSAAPVLFQAFARLKPSLTPQPPAPQATLLLSNPQLPPPLRQFRPRNAVFNEQGGPKVDFPPNGAEVALLDGKLKLRISGGRAPFAFLMDGGVVLTGAAMREVMLTPKGRGFVTLQVIDADGRSAQIQLRVL